MISLQANTYEHNWGFFDQHGGKSFPVEHLRKAVAEIEEFCNVLEGEGVKVVRPDHIEHAGEYTTPDFKSTGEHVFKNPNILQQMGWFHI